MIELPGSFSGMRDLAEARSAARDASQRTSLAIFISAAASVFSAPCACTIASCAASASNLFGAVTKRQAGRARRARRRRARRTPGCALSPVPTAVPPSASSRRCGSAARSCAIAVIELRDPAGDLLAERQRRRVLQVRAADLDDVGEGRRPSRPACRAARASAGSSVLLDAPARAATCIAVGKDVVRRLAAVDVVVRMHQALFADRRRRAAARRGWRAPRSRSCWSACPSRSARPTSGNCVVVAAGEHLVGGGDDRVGLVARRACRARG